MIDRVIVEADGGSRGNPGPAGYGALVRDPADGQILATRNEYLGVATNNVAEYRGLIAGLQAALELGARAVDVRMDSKLVIEQTSGRWQVKHPDMKPLAREAVALLARFEDRTMDWIPRERNRDADRLANEAMDAGTGTARTTAPPPRTTVPPPRTTVPPPPTPDPAAGTGGWAPVDAVTTRLLLVRHATTDDSPRHRLSGRGGVGLNATGRAEAAALAGRMRRDLPRTGNVTLVSSPVARARETADAIAASTGLTVALDDDLAELDFGQWQGLTPADLAARWPREFEAWVAAASDDVRPPAGESLGELRHRVRAVRRRLVAAHSGGTVVIVSHLTPIHALIVEALDAPTAAMMRLVTSPAGVSELTYHVDGAASLRSLDDREHLRATAGS